jgi:hypothetical protein
MKNLLLTVSVVCLLVAGYTTVNGGDWVYYAASKGLGDKYYYDETSIFSDGEGAVRIWIKQVLSDEGKQRFMESMKQNGYSDTGKLESISYVLNHLAFKCSTKEYKLISNSVRDATGNVVDSDSPQPTWNPVPPKSIMEILYKTVCKGRK